MAGLPPGTMNQLMLGNVGSLPSFGGPGAGGNPFTGANFGQGSAGSYGQHAAGSANSWMPNVDVGFNQLAPTATPQQFQSPSVGSSYGAGAQQPQSSGQPTFQSFLSGLMQQIFGGGYGGFSGGQGFGSGFGGAQQPQQPQQQQPAQAPSDGSVPGVMPQASMPQVMQSPQIRSILPGMMQTQPGAV